MLCPECGQHKSRIIDTRQKNKELIERVRQCQHCDHPWVTIEKKKEKREVIK